MKKYTTINNERFLPNGNPRKILALDGGGIRGVLTLEILLEMETQLKKELKKGEDFCLGDYFDYIGGTSTGAIIAAGLSLGMKVETLLDFYQKKGKAMFDKAFILNQFWHSYNKSPLEKELRKTFGGGDIDLESERFKTLLLIVTMNLSTDSPWPISNNPWAKYNALNRMDCNLRIPLYKLVRASTAAPTFFPPEILQWDPDDPKKTFVFVDGGVTPYNNPAFLMYRMATQKAYGLEWETGEKKLLIVSLGTGSAVATKAYENKAETAINIANNLMYAMQVDQDINCRTVGRCIYGAKIDRELDEMIPMKADGTIESLDNDAGKHFSYIRYNADLSQEALNEMGLKHIKSEQVRKMDSTKYIAKLREVGRVTGQNQVNIKNHFKFFLNT